MIVAADGVVKLFPDCPTADRIAEKIAAKNEGTKNMKVVPFVSITPSLFMLPFSLVWQMQQIKPTPLPMASAAPGL